MKPEKKSFLNLLWCLILVLTVGCTGSKKSTSSVIDRGKLMFVDQSDNGYVLRGQRSLIKYDFRNHPTDRHDFDLSVHQVDLSTDLRIFAFNPDFQKFYILDKYLNVITDFSFNEYFDFLASHPILANGQTIWLYNQTENKIQQYTSQLKFLDETRNLDWEIPGVHVDKLIFHRNELYLVDYSKGIFIFDYAGRLRQRIPISMPMSDVQIDRTMSRIFAYYSHQWYVIDADDRIPGYVPLEVPGIPDFSNLENVVFENGKMYRWNISLQQIEVNDLPANQRRKQF